MKKFLETGTALFCKISSLKICKISSLKIFESSWFPRNLFLHILNRPGSAQFILEIEEMLQPYNTMISK
jgi:hypothetical protein|tara:strand:+ start:595 stop:801 length:207 start_codon:yes stop_codon:yes gene_type:complete